MQPVGTVSGVASGTADEVLLQVPIRIHQFRESIHYGDFSNTHDELDKKWQYVAFLEQLIKGINDGVTAGDVLTADDIKAIGLFARMTVVLRQDYVVSTFRGASGFESRAVDATINLEEEVVEDLVSGIGRHLSLYRKQEGDWDERKVQAWQRHFREVAKVEPDDD